MQFGPCSRKDEAGEAGREKGSSIYKMPELQLFLQEKIQMKGQAKGSTVFLIGTITVLIAVGSLAFILWSITDYSERCKTERMDVCDTFTGPSFPLLVIVLIIAGLVLISSTVVYILVTT